MKIKVTGEIVSDEFSWIYSLFEVDHFCPQMLRQAIEAPENADDRELTLEINSPGGSVWAGFDIYSILQGLQLEGWNVAAHVTAMAASAASTIMAACSTVLLSPVAQVMIHDPMTSTRGNIRDHQESVGFLNSIKESIINAYMAKCKGKTTRAKFRKLMENSTWMPAQQAIELGLADGIIGGEEVTAGTDLVLTVSNSAGADGTRTALLQRYIECVRNGHIEEDPAHPISSVLPLVPSAENDAPVPEVVNVSESDTDWQRKARLAVERQRCKI